MVLGYSSPNKRLSVPHDGKSNIIGNARVDHTEYEVNKAFPAKFFNNEVKTFSVDAFDKDSTFYIDSNLSDNQKGETIAKELFGKGFKNLYLATGYEPEEFCHLNFLKGVIGKDPPW